MELNEYQQKSDEQLVKLALQDQQAFGVLISRYEGKLAAYVMRLSNISKEDAQDILQDVFIKAYYNLNSFDADLKFSSWIYRIAHNQVISHYRKTKARPQGHSWSIDALEFETLASELDASKQADLNLLKENISQILEKMDVKYREALVLKFLEQKSYTEISDILKKPVGTVGTLINRAKKQFKDEAKKIGISF